MIPDLLHVHMDWLMYAVHMYEVCKHSISTTQHCNSTYPLQWLITLRCGLLDPVPVGFTSWKEKQQTQLNSSVQHSPAKDTWVHFNWTCRQKSWILNQLKNAAQHLQSYLHWLWVVWFLDLAISTLVNLNKKKNIRTLNMINMSYISTSELKGSFARCKQMCLCRDSFVMKQWQPCVDVKAHIRPKKWTIINKTSGFPAVH